MNIAFVPTAAAVASPSYATAREPSWDEMLIRRIAGGDQLAMRALFARHQTPLYRWLLRIVRDASLAEDLLSDVFWRSGRKPLRSRRALRFDGDRTLQGAFGATSPDRRAIGR